MLYLAIRHNNYNVSQFVSVSHFEAVLIGLMRAAHYVKLSGELYAIRDERDRFLEHSSCEVHRRQL